METEPVIEPYTPKSPIVEFLSNNLWAIILGAPLLLLIIGIGVLIFPLFSKKSRN